MGTLGKAIYTVGFWIRETGQAIDRLGCRLQGSYYFQEQCIAFMFYAGFATEDQTIAIPSLNKNWDGILSYQNGWNGRQSFQFQFQAQNFSRQTHP